MPEREEIKLVTPKLRHVRGRLSDWITQRWVQATGHRVDLSVDTWLRGPVGDVDVIGHDYFARLAARHGLEIDETSSPRGLLRHLSVLASPTCDTSAVPAEVAAFYERTSEYEFDVWSDWSPLFRPFGSLLATTFSRRLEQLNVPLSPLETSHGFNSRVLKLRDAEGNVRHTAWVRTLLSTGKTLYAGDYSTCRIPLDGTNCVKVAFPLPNGHATVVMRPFTDAGALTLRSAGRGFGDAGFYFFVSDGEDTGWARYVASLKEDIRVYVDDRGVTRADHSLQLWGIRFLRMHYRMRNAASAS
jgi:hypothetical protein